MYKYRVDYTKVFVNGNLAGLTYHDTLKFCDWQSANAFAMKAGQVFKDCTGASDYRMESPILEAIQPNTRFANTPNALPNNPALIG